MTPTPEKRTSNMDEQEICREIRHLYAKGLSCAAVGRRIGRSHHFVHKRLKSMGVPRRTSRDYARKALHFEDCYDVQESGCWRWTAGVTGSGYGAYRHKRRTVSAHRLAFRREKGEIPDGWQVHHRCRNKLCVNPQHLEAIPTGEHVAVHDNVTTRNKKKTHCKRGHPFNEANTYHIPSGGRACRECKRIWDRQRYGKEKAA